MTHNHEIFYLGDRVVKTTASGPLYGQRKEDQVSFPSSLNNGLPSARHRCSLPGMFTERINMVVSN